MKPAAYMVVEGEAILGILKKADAEKLKIDWEHSGGKAEIVRLFSEKAVMELLTKLGHFGNTLDAELED